jgi:hypothetical protein
MLYGTTYHTVLYFHALKQYFVIDDIITTIFNSIIIILYNNNIQYDKLFRRLSTASAEMRYAEIEYIFWNLVRLVLILPISLG